MKFTWKVLGMGKFLPHTKPLAAMIYIFNFPKDDVVFLLFDLKDNRTQLK